MVTGMVGNKPWYETTRWFLHFEWL